LVNQVPRRLYTPAFVIDSNFKAVHLHQRHLEDDVYLSDGTGFMAPWVPYVRFLQGGLDWIEVSALAILFHSRDLS
jgi:hypothetical protein